jgi:hypothetical protein
MVYEAYQLRAKFDAGLQLAGQDEDGELQFMGSREEFDQVEILEDTYKM